MADPIPDSVRSMVVMDAEADAEEIAKQVDFVFCAVNMKKDEIKALEERYAKLECPVVSNNSAHRHTPDVPMVVPEINADDIKQFAAEVGKSDTDSKNTEVVLVEATDSDAASRVETALTNRYNSIFQQNASYSAEKLDMVKNCKVTKDGNFVTMIIGEKASDMLTMFNDSIK